VTPSPADILTEARRIRDIFASTGGEIVKADILQPAETLLDLYGEDIRARAYVTQDPVQGEMMLRPDFTLPIVQMHMQNRVEPARYAYSGKVFRKQEQETGRPCEYVQVGYEVFDGRSPPLADAEVFSLVSTALKGANLRPATGDIGILTAAVRGLRTSQPRKDALLRHIWRPARFRRLLERFGGRSAVPPSRAALIKAQQAVTDGMTHIGLREISEISERVLALKADADEPAISSGEVDLLEDLLRYAGKCDAALTYLRDLSVDLPEIAGAVARMARRLTALDERGVDVSDLDFEASYGRSQMEYYDGFVFGFYAEDRPDLPPVATGGRYDALTRRLGQGQAIPAIGAVVRPALLLEAQT
jgi:ATP phosphoribosyltransferase regulatory subunit